MTLESRTQGLLDVVESDRKRRCGAILDEARARAAATIAAAHADARRRLRHAFAEERKQLEARVAAAHARLHTHQRAHARRRSGDLLAAGSLKLAVALQARWRDPQSRAAWINAVIGEARKALPRGAWRILHAQGWPDDERAAVATTLAAALGAPPQFVVADRIDAGLRITAGGNVIDGTLEGLTADRAEIGARLLGALEREG